MGLFITAAVIDHGDSELIFTEVERFDYLRNEMGGIDEVYVVCAH